MPPPLEQKSPLLGTNSPLGGLTGPRRCCLVPHLPKLYYTTTKSPLRAHLANAATADANAAGSRTGPRLIPTTASVNLHWTQKLPRTQTLSAATSLRWATNDAVAVTEVFHK
eukprot:g34595.t1